MTKPVSAALLGLLMTSASSLALAQSAAPVAPAQPVTLPPVTAAGAAPAPTPTSSAGSLTAPTADIAKSEIVDKAPGAVAVVKSEAWANQTATTLKDVLDYTPGVFAQPKWGEDTRLSIRGSGLSRNFHLRGVMLYQDGVPNNASDGSGDFQEIDPTAFRYVEVYKGSNGLRYGANTLGGAINFVSPTGYDAPAIAGRAEIGSFGTRRLQASAGGVAGTVDAFVTGSWLKSDGFRNHSSGESFRGSGNFGWKPTDRVETRFYLTAADIDQYIPGSVTRQTALTAPKTAAAGNLTQNYQRNMTSFRLGNKTTLKLSDETKLEFGGYALNKHLIHPIYQYLDYEYNDFGGFGRVVDERRIGGMKNHFTIGLNAATGWVDNKQYVNRPGAVKGAQLSGSTDRTHTTVIYAEDALDVHPDVSVIAGGQQVFVTQRRNDRFVDAVNVSGEQDYSFFNPKAGAIWRINPQWQVFGNVSRSGEAPSFGDLNFTNLVLGSTKAQRATTFEVGTRGGDKGFSWDLTLYRSHLRNELQFFDLGGGNYQVTNADKSVHQGVELGASVAAVKGLFSPGANPDEIRVNLAYSLNDFHFDGDKSWRNNKIPGAPRHQLRAEAVYQHPNGFYAGPNVEWVPQAYYVDNANTQKTKAYALLGLKAGYAFNDHVSLFAEGRNLTNEKYISSVSVAARATSASALYEPGTGRAAFAGLRVTW